MSVKDESIVAGRRLGTSIDNFVRRCEAFITEELEDKTIPDKHLIALLCDAVRLAREYTDSRRVDDDEVRAQALRDAVDRLIDLIPCPVVVDRELIAAHTVHRCIDEIRQMPGYVPAKGKGDG